MVDLLPTAEQESIVDAVQSFLRDKLPIDRLHPKGDRPIADDREHWQSFAEFGWFGLGLPEDVGGTGASLAEEMMVFREFGRHLLTPSMFATVIAAHMLHAAGKTDRVEEIVSGQQAVCFANLLAGSKELQLFDMRAGDLILGVSAGRLVLFDASSVNVGPTAPSFDETVSVARAALPLNPPLADVTGDNPLFNRASTLIAAMMAGIAEATRDMGVAYAKIREQFGQPIGGFQAIKHHCADMAARADAAYSASVFAALSVVAGRSDATFQAAAARIVAADAAVRNAATNIQVHGGIGFTAECDANLFLKRAHLLEKIGGATRGQQRLLAEQQAAE